MPKNNLKTTIEKASKEFADAIVKAVKESSLQELMEIQHKPGTKKKVRKPRPKSRKKAAREKPGPKRKKRAVVKKRSTRKKTTAKPRKKATKKARRLSPAQKAGVQNKIHEYLKKNPGSSRGKVAKAIKMPTAKTGLYLRELKKAGKIKSKGKAAATTYSAG